MADGIISQHEEIHLRLFRDQLALNPNTADTLAAAQLDQVTTDRLMLDARLADLAFDDETHLADLSIALSEAGLTPAEGNDILAQEWEVAVQGILEDGLLSLDEENALNRYMNDFNLGRDQLDRYGVLTQVVKSAVLRDINEGIVPQRQTITGRVPFNP